MRVRLCLRRRISEPWQACTSRLTSQGEKYQVTYPSFDELSDACPCSFFLGCGALPLHARPTSTGNRSGRNQAREDTKIKSTADVEQRSVALFRRTKLGKTTLDKMAHQ